MSAVTGEPRVWARDMAIVGGVTAFLAPMPALPLATMWFIGATTVTGAVTGAAFGAAMPGALEVLRRRLPLAALLAFGPIPGALWGGIVGALGFGLSGGVAPLAVCVLCAAIAGALQFGLFWFPYTFQTVRGAPRWPVVLGACVLTPLIGVLTMSAVLFAMFGFSGIWL
ncbi:MAG: hypothetical protein P8R54_09365 [Myxococcota bacterium]|nr:hypothetical protein [Myxococcota bacterium]